MGLVRETLKRHSLQCELLVLTDGEQAISFMNEVEAGRLSCPHLIVLDLNLPKRSGWEVLEHTRRGECSRAPVIILTSSDNERDKEQAALLGASRYVRKPTRLGDFLKLGGIFLAAMESSE